MIDDKRFEEDSLLQIQPVRLNCEEWRKLAESEGLSFEVLELSMPPALNESGLFDEILKWYKNSGLVTSLHGNFIDVNPGSGDILIRELAEKRLRQSCETAKVLGAGNVIFHSSCFPFLRGAYLEGWAALSADKYESLADEYDLNIFIENSQDIDTVPLKTLMGINKSSRIGVCLDIGHANYSGTPVSKWFEDLADHIRYIHLSDNNGVYDDHLTLGKGTVDWDEVNSLYAALGRKVPMTLEVGPLESVASSLDYLKNNRYFGLKKE